MNICLLSPTFLPKIGGAEIVVASLAKHLTSRGHNVIVITQQPRRGKGIAQDDILPYRVIRYRRPWSFTISLGMHDIYKSLKRGNDEFGFDIIHCHIVYPVGYVAMKFAKKHNIPVIITAHGSDIRPTSRYRKKRAIWRRIVNSLNEANYVTAISSHMQGILEEITNNPNKTLIPNGVDVEHLSQPIEYQGDWPIDEDIEFVLYIGGLKRIKGLDVLLQAIAMLKEECHRDRSLSNVKFVIAGKGPMKEELIRDVREKGLDGIVYFVGEVTGDFKRYLLQRARFVVLPSRSEAMPLVPLESFAVGKPVLATAVGGLVDIIEEGKTGKLIKPEDPRALCDAMIELLSSDNAKMAEMGHNARERAKNYDWANITKLYEQLYMQII